MPVDTVKRLVPQLISHGRPIEAGIAGVRYLSDWMAARLGLSGVVIREVAGGSQAAGLGLEGIGVDRRGRYILGDVIVAVNGEPVASVDDLRDRFEDAGVGATVVLTVERGDRRTDVRAELVRIG